MKKITASHNKDTAFIKARDHLASIQCFLRSFVEIGQRSGADQNNGVFAYYQLLLDKGRSFMGRWPSKRFPAAVDFARWHHPRPKQCYYNAQMFALNCPQARYFEGYAHFGLIPFHHAWIVLGDHNSRDKVADHTLEAADRLARKQGMGPIKANELAYLGVEVPTANLRKYVVQYRSSEPYAPLYFLGTGRCHL